MDRLKVDLFGGCSEEHPISVKSAQELQKNLDIEKYETVLYRDTKTGAWKLCDGPDANGKTAVRRPAELSPTETSRMLVLEQGQTNESVWIWCFPFCMANLARMVRCQGLLELSGIPYVGCDVQSSALVVWTILAYIVARSAGIATARISGLSRPTRY